VELGAKSKKRKDRGGGTRRKKGRGEGRKKKGGDLQQHRCKTERVRVG